MATGSEILSYRPDARLAGGLNETPAGTGADILNPFNNTMQQLASQRFQWDVNRYQQGIKDRDELLKMVQDLNKPSSISDGGAAADALKGIDILDQDKKILQTQLDSTNRSILDTVKKYGNPKANLTAYSKIQNDIKNYQQAVQAAKVRAVMGKDFLTKAADETNQLDRQDILNHYNKEILNSDINHLPQPYFKRFKYDESTVAPNVEMKDVGKKYEGDYEVISKATPLEAFRYNTNFLNLGQDNAKNLIQHQQVMYEDAMRSGLLNNKDEINRINKRLDDFNNYYHLQPGDADYANHIAEIDADGNVVNPVDSPAQFARALHIYGKFSHNDERTISKDKIALNKSKADIAQSYASAEASRANAAESYYNIQDKKATLQARIADLNEKAVAAKNKNEASQGTAYGAAASTLGLIERFRNRAPLTDFKGASNKAKLIDHLGVSDNAEFIEIPKSDATIQRMFATPKYDDMQSKVIGREFTKARYFMVKDGNDVKFVGIDDPNTITPSSIKVIDVKEAPSEIIRSDNNFNVSDKDNMAMGLANKIISETFGQPSQQQPSNASQAKPNIPAGTVREVRGHTYEFDGENWIEK